MAIKRILVGKFGTCAGQVCITIDYVLVEKKFLSTAVTDSKRFLALLFWFGIWIYKQKMFLKSYVLADQVELMKAVTEKMFGENPRETNTVTRIVNKQHFLRLKNLVDDPRVTASIVYGGKMDEENL